MGINYIIQTNPKWQDHTDPDLKFEGMAEDDVLYAELRRQVLLLLGDDDENENEEIAKTRDSNSYCSACKQGSSRPTNSFPTILQPGSYFSWWDRETIQSVPTWLVKFWRTSNGTGVFIPQIIQTRRYRHGRTTNRRRAAYKQTENY